jgi:hypothetical protein
MFPFVFPPGYPFSPTVLSQGSSSSSHTPTGHSSSMTTHGNNSLSQKRSTTHRYVYNQIIIIVFLYFTRPIDNNSQQQQQHHSKFSMSHEDHKSKKPHIKKPLNAFMLFMKEQRAQVVQECTLRESAAINQILGRKVSSEKKIFLIKKIYLYSSSGTNSIVMFNKNIMIWHGMNE